MVDKSEPNAQNSEINPDVHPSGARIEKMMANTENDRMKKENEKEQEAARRAGVERPSVEKAVEKGQYGETLRPSEREDRIVLPQDEPAEGGRDEIPDFGANDTGSEMPSAPHRMDADNREARE